MKCPKVLAILASVALLGCHVFGQVRLGTNYPMRQPLVVRTPSWSIYANPAQNAGITTYLSYVTDQAGNKTAANRVIAAGAQHYYALIQWPAAQPTSTTFLDYFVDQFVNQSGNLPLWLTIGVVDTDGLKHAPSDIAGLEWDDPITIATFNALEDHIAARANGRIVLLVVGNEADFYFTANPSQITKFATFLAAVKAHARLAFGSDIRISTTFQFAAVVHWSDYAPITAVTDWESFTYYHNLGNPPLTDYSVADFFANGPWIFQELGATSNTAVWGVDQTVQNACVVAATTFLPLFPHFMGATWFTLSDYSTAVLGNVGYVTPALEFFAETGLRTTANASKTGWDTLVTFLHGTP